MHYYKPVGLAPDKPLTLLRLRALSVLLAFILAGLLGCASSPEEEQIAQQPQVMYADAKRSLDNGNYRGAIQKLERLETRYPFGEFAQQARLDLIHAYHRAGDRESAQDAAEKFIRENPRHPNVDYAYYMKGVIEYRETENVLTRALRIDTGGRPPSGMERAFASFSQFLLRFPDSEYAADAHQRMLRIRNRLAEYEFRVAEYYMERRAYVAAIGRATYILENYQQSSFTPAALALMVNAYRELGMEESASQTEAVLRASYPDYSSS